MRAALFPLGMVKRFSSLYVNGGKASGKCSVVSPFLNFDVHTVPQKKAHLLLRQTSVNLDDISSLWREYTEVKDMKNKLEEKKRSIGEKVNQLKRDRKLDEMEKLTKTGKLLRDDLKQLMDTFRTLEEQVFLKILDLPNDLDFRTRSDEHVFKSFLDPSPEGLHHLSSGKYIVGYKNPYTYFLKGTAALFELGALQYFHHHLTHQGFIPFSSPDFARDVVLQGCGLPKKGSSFPLASHHDEINLTGGASLASVCSFHAKTIHNERLPIKYVAKGRQYYEETMSEGLYSVWQKSAIQLFLGSEHDVLQEYFDSSVQTVCRAYEELGIPFRMVYAAAKDLGASESLRVSFQLFSPFLGKYVESGNLSLYGSFISKRLRMYYCHGDELEFLHFFSGSVIKVPTLLAVLLEYGSNKKIPECISRNMGGIEFLVK